MSSVWPLARLDATAIATLDFSKGTADLYDSPLFYTDWQGYDGHDLYKIDVNVAGRYLSFKISSTT
jgi:hypothetical protein